MIGKLLIYLLVFYQLYEEGVHRLCVSGTRLRRADNCRDTVTVTLPPSTTTSVSSLVLTRTVPSIVNVNRDQPATTVRTLTTTITSTVVLTTVVERHRESVASKADSELIITPSSSQPSSCTGTTVTKTCINNNNSTTVECVAKITAENIVEVALPWHGARQECRRRGGDLATPCYPADFINYIRDNYHKNALFWLGASDTESPNTFKWSTGASVAGPWYPGHPQEGRSGFHCLGIQYTDERQSGIISGYDCTSSRWYICTR
ncbi:unnamed protein product [Meganyctiphanes norvegica]|uniref:C-type lectin domain-containing protein n=1 Tax=Meganyctiphanes norvegica TaxID=48144 RepID=A0AAV2RQZ5_MEGNR